MVTSTRGTTPTRQSSTSTVDFHRGEVLWALANTYPNLNLTVVEAIQNGIDADATRILVAIDLRNRTVIITDDGNGVTQEHFEKALASVGQTVKTKDKLGRFGRGLIAPLNKCTRFVFVSCPTGSRKTRSWTFVGADIRQQHHRLEIPLTESFSMPTLPRRFKAYASDEFNVTWRTMVALRGVTKDKVVSLVDLDILESEIRQKLGQRMRERNVSVRAILIDETNREQSRDINPVTFTGEPLPAVSYQDPVAGEVQFELYRAPKLAGVRKGEVVVTELGDSYGVPIKDIVFQARGGKGEWYDLLKPVFTALTSGYFEGVVRCKNIELAPERTKFEFNEALQSFYLVLLKWFEECGKGYFDDEEVVSREERWQDLGLQSQQRLREILMNRPEYQRLWDGLKNAVKLGRLGDGHLEPEHGLPNGFEDDPSLRSGQGGAGTGRDKGTGGNTAGGDRQREPKDRSGDIPTGVTGPRGKRRQLVKGDSQGLWFEYSWLEGSSHLWEFDFDRGILTFNVRHPHWVRLDESNGKHTKKNARWIMALQEWLALAVLTLVRRYNSTDELELHRDFVDDQVGPYIDLFITAAR